MGKIGDSKSFSVGYIFASIAMMMFILMMVSCDSSGSGGDSLQPGGSAAREGIFVDSVIEGLEYETSTHSGVTDKDGTFKYAEGETVNFFIGDLFIGEARTKAVISPLDLVPDAVNETHPAVINIARLLQTMDWDGNCDNGITITALARKTLTGVYSINFDQSTDDFSNDLNVQALLDNLNNADVFGMEKRMLYDADSAMSHFQHTLQEHPSITIKAPSGGEKLMAKDDCEITWKAVSFIRNVAILISTDGGLTWNETPITASTPNDGSYTWDAVPFTLKSTQCRFRIADADAIAENESIADASARVVHDDTDGDFTIHLTKGKVQELIQTSRAEDSDNDNLPDDVEQMLGTSPRKRDSDNDGIFDYDEIFGGTGYRPDEPLADQDNDGKIAALDADEDDDNINDGELIDTDGDGIPNYLEYYGFTYDWFSDTYSLWDGVSIDEKYFKTDPLQPSTDQDPYSDGMEASGNLIDVLIHHPGNLPMVPAYPNIVVQLEGYEVILNSDISYSRGGSFSEQTSWSRQTTVERSFETGLNWEVGTEVGVKAGALDWGGAKYSAKIGMNYNWTQTNSASKSFGASITEESNWQKAVSSNPSTAAKIKLKLKVYNYGTAAASNIIPTLTMKIGGMSVMTFKPNDPMGILEPGGIYPAQEGTYWVVDKIHSTDTEIFLSLDELRALESGAPLNIEVTQIDGEVMLLNASGQWEFAGKWGEYMARCEAVSANIKIDIGDGNFIHHLVYADDTKTAPIITLGDALRWIANYEERSDAPYMSYIDRFGFPQEAALVDWNFIFDQNTLIKNGVNLETKEVPEGLGLTDMILNQDTSIIIRAPREVIGLLEPEIYYAYYDHETRTIKVAAGDYNGITGAFFIDKDGTKHPMEEVMKGTGEFVFDTATISEIYEPIFNVATDVEGELVESVEVLNRDGASLVRHVIATFSPDRAAKTVQITGVGISARSNVITANIDHDEYFPPKIKAYLSNGDVLDLDPHPMYWDPQFDQQWQYNYANANYVPRDFAGAWVIAEVETECNVSPSPTANGSSNCFAAYQIPEDAVFDDGSCGSGEVQLSGYFTGGWPVTYHVVYYAIDFDNVDAGSCVAVPIRQEENVLYDGFNYDVKYDLALKPLDRHGYLEAIHGAKEVPGSVAFEDINAGNIVGRASQDGTGGVDFFDWATGVTKTTESYPNKMWVINTDGGKYVKLKINWVYERHYAFTTHSVAHARILWATYEP